MCLLAVHAEDAEAVVRVSQMRGISLRQDPETRINMAVLSPQPLACVELRHAEDVLASDSLREVHPYAHELAGGGFLREGEELRNSNYCLALLQVCTSVACSTL